jgi:uncharacterized protein Usg
MPDHTSLLQEFLWQTEDVPPEFPRVKRFLDYWTQHIEAVINQVFLAVEGPTGSTRFADAMFLLDDTRPN